MRNINFLTSCASSNLNLHTVDSILITELIRLAN